MRKRIAFIIVTACVLLITGCGDSNSAGDSTGTDSQIVENAEQTDTESYTDTFPENNGETNFNRELGMPYAQVEGGIAVLYKNEWYLCTPVLSPLDGVTMEVTECSDTSVTYNLPLS